MHKAIQNIGKTNKESFFKRSSVFIFPKFRMVFLLIIIFSNCLFSQSKKFILIDNQTKKQSIKKDSISSAKFLDSLAENNYYFTKIIKVEEKDNQVRIYFDKGRNYNEAQIKLSDTLAKQLKLESKFYTKNLDSLKKAINQKFVNQGYTFNRIITKYQGINHDIPEVQLSINEGLQRKIDGFELRGYEKVPKRFVKNLEKQYKGKSYDQKNLSSIQQSLQNHAFVTLEKTPQTLFTKDSTKVFLFLQKKKSNSFDGVIGFGNDKTENFSFNGTLNVNFKNMFNGFETANIYWQRNPDKGQTFNLGVDVPYLFKSNIGTNINVNIYRQDSTFATVKFQPALYYNLGNYQKLGIRGHLETSTVMDSLYVQGKDFNRKGFGVWYEFLQPIENPLLLYRTKLRAEADLLNTKYSLENISAKQSHIYLLAEHNLPISGQHWLNLKGETALLNSDNTFTTNELMRFGGWNSMRGFNENSLYADFYYYGNLEYRYLIGEQAFFDSFFQYGQLHNKSLNLKPRLYSFGVGFNFFLPIGLMTFQISNGNEFGNPIKFGDTKIHWGIVSRF